MANYEMDEITIADGNLVTIGPNDKILGMKSDGTKFIVLRLTDKR